MWWVYLTNAHHRRVLICRRSCFTGTSRIDKLLLLIQIPLGMGLPHEFKVVFLLFSQLRSPPTRIRFVVGFSTVGVIRPCVLLERVSSVGVGLSLSFLNARSRGGNLFKRLVPRAVDTCERIRPRWQQRQCWATIVGVDMNRFPTTRHTVVILTTMSCRGSNPTWQVLMRGRIRQYGAMAGKVAITRVQDVLIINYCILNRYRNIHYRVI